MSMNVEKMCENTYQTMQNQTSNRMIHDFSEIMGLVWLIEFSSRRREKNGILAPTGVR
jgi:hypothetical protein